jgi:hypothetical protein
MVIMSNYQFQELTKALNTVQQLLGKVRRTAETNFNYASYPDKTMSKAELACLMGVSPRTFASLLYPLRGHLRKMGVSDNAKRLPPQAVRFVCEQLEITSPTH